MSEFDKLLGDLADELEALDNGHGEGPNSEQILDVLKRRLLPLLEVGQYYRDCIAGEDKEACAENDRAWDAAKQAAMAGR